MLAPLSRLQGSEVPRFIPASQQHRRAARRRARIQARSSAVQEAAEQEGAPALKPPPLRPARPHGAAENSPRMAAARRAAAAAATMRTAPKVTLAVVGDVHSQWDADSEAALLSLGADVAVFVGDFGEENVQLIERIAAVPHPKAVMLGNHDAWFSLTRNGRQRYARAMLASSSLAMRQQHAHAEEGGSTPAIAAQLQALGQDHIGYGSKRFPQLGLTLLGARPFSKGGKQWSDVADFYEEHYGVGGMRDSAHRILDVALAARAEDVKVLVAHNGPRGLGGRRFNICGVDWTEPEADFGDPDLQEALDMMTAQGVHVPLVLFGHMHSQLKGSGKRNMAEVDPATGTVYLNAATVPRIRSFPPPSAEADAGDGSPGSNGSPRGRRGSGKGGSSASAGGSSRAGGICGHHFLLVELRQGLVSAARDVWVGVQRDDEGDGSRTCTVLREQELVRTSLAAHALQCSDGASDSEPAAAGSAATLAGAAARQREQQVGAGPEAAVAAGGEAEAAGSAAVEADQEAYVCSVFRAFSAEWEPFVVQLPAAKAAAQLAELG